MAQKREKNYWSQAKIDFWLLISLNKPNTKKKKKKKNFNMIYRVFIHIT